MLEDLLYTNLWPSVNQQTLLAVKDTLLGCQLLLQPGFKLQTQMILSFFVNSEEDELAKHLCISPSFVSEYLKPKLTSEDEWVVTVTLRKTKALTKSFGNRQLFRQCGVLQLLEDLAFKFTGSVTEDDVTELVCSLLSDPPDEEDADPFPVLTEFLGATSEGFKMPTLIARGWLWTCKLQTSL